MAPGARLCNPRRNPQGKLRYRLQFYRCAVVLSPVVVWLQPVVDPMLSSDIHASFIMPSG